MVPVVSRHRDAACQINKMVTIQAVVGDPRISNRYANAVFNKIRSAGVCGPFKLILLHLIARTAVQFEANIASHVCVRPFVQIERVACYRREKVSFDLDSRDIVLEISPVHGHSVWVARGVDLHGGGETRESTEHRPIVRTGAGAGVNIIHQTFLGDRKTRIFRIDASAVPVRVGGGVAEVAP